MPSMVLSNPVRKGPTSAIKGSGHLSPSRMRRETTSSTWVIGKEAGEGQRYVRPAGEPKHSRVYIVKIDPEALPVRFDDWIDKDLLNISAWDIERLTLKDYTFQVAQTLRGPITDFEQRLEITVSDDNGTWNLDSLMEDRDGNLTPTELLEGEELNQERSATD